MSKRFDDLVQHSVDGNGGAMIYGSLMTRFLITFLIAYSHLQQALIYTSW